MFTMQWILFHYTNQNEVSEVLFPLLSQEIVGKCILRLLVLGRRSDMSRSLPCPGWGHRFLPHWTPGIRACPEILPFVVEHH